ncbi:hypothetical protein C8J56DRAFT_963503 [Mycena floridula]|nr:hypothetical protein C8J56DRAFT_963503 [Mycena floridula]
MTFQALPKELLHEIIPFLVDEEDYQYESYPESMDHYASSSILSLSLVNGLLRRICYPFLFHYLRCKSIEQLEKLESECLAQSAFTRFLRILDIDMGYTTKTHVQSIQEGLVRLLGCPLPSLVWLKFHRTPTTTALLAAINAHHSLENAVIMPNNLISLSSSPVSLEKIHFREFHEISQLSIVQHRNIQVTCLHLDAILVSADSDLKLQLTTMIIRGLRVLDITEAGDADMNAEFVDCLRAFVAHHPDLTNIDLKNGSLRRDPYFLSSFVDSAEAHFLGGTFNLLTPDCIVLSPIRSTGDARWGVTKLALRLHSNSSLEALALAGSIFLRVSSLTLTCFHNDIKIHIDDLVGSISKHFLNLRVLELRNLHPALMWTPPSILTCAEFSDERPFDDVAACMRWLAWSIFKASSCTVKVSIIQNNLLSVQESLWFFSASYRPRRDLLGIIFKMDIDSSVMIVGHREGRQPILTFRGAVAV